MRFTLILFLVTLMIFSCKEEPKQNGTLNIPEPTDTKIPTVPKVDKSKINNAPVHRLILDNPLLKEVGVKQLPDDKVYQKSKTGYTTIILTERPKLEYTIDGKKSEFEIPKGEINILLNPGKLDYYLTEIVYVNNKKSDDGPFETKDTAIPKLKGEGSVIGPYKLIQGQEVITGFDLAPMDQVPEEIAAAGADKIKRFYRLQRYWAKEK